MRYITIILLTLIQPIYGEITLEDAKENGMWETLKAQIKAYTNIADICVFERKWIPGSSPKGQLIERAVVTHVHCGLIEIGDIIERVHDMEAPWPEPFTETVQGDLWTFFFNPSDAKEVGKVSRFEGDGTWGFYRVGHIHSELFDLELKSNPKLRSKSEQDEDDQAAADLDSKPR